MHFKIIKKDTKTRARIAEITLNGRKIETPIFMPVATSAAIKGLHGKDLVDASDPQIILANTYHLYLRPGHDIIKNSGGIHNFMSWDRNVLTDSGGYQVYSLSNNRKIEEDGVKFKSHIDGSYHFFSPEKAIQIQKSIGADIIMAFDECTPYPCEKNYARKSMNLTHRWLQRCIKEFNESENNNLREQFLFPIVQGSIYADLRRESAEFISSMDLPGNAIGGLSVGEPHDLMYEMCEIVCDKLPETKPRYLMGVGTPTNILENISLGVDMFDCVMPTRNARNGQFFTWFGKINIINSKYKDDLKPISENCKCYTCVTFTRAYIRHLFKINDTLGLRLATLHNVYFYMELMKEIRMQISKDSFFEWSNKIKDLISSKV